MQGGGIPGRKTSNREDWLDPFIGTKALSALGGSNFFISGSVLIGGFGVGSELMWDAALNLGYNWTKSVSTTIGYRYLDVDYDADGFIYDVNQDGPAIGLS